jgi:hypothetical protein
LRRRNNPPPSPGHQIFVIYFICLLGGGGMEVLMNFFSREPYQQHIKSLIRLASHNSTSYSSFVWMSLIHSVANQVTWSLEFDVTVTWRKLQALCRVWAIALRAGSKTNVRKVKAGHFGHKVKRPKESTTAFSAKRRSLLRLRSLLSHEGKGKRYIRKGCLIGTSTNFLCFSLCVTTWQWRFRKVPTSWLLHYSSCIDRLFPQLTMRDTYYTNQPTRIPLFHCLK